MTDLAGRPRVLYVAGSGRSGSTVLAQYLEDLLDVVHLGEARYVWDRGVDQDQLCECGRTFGSCEFWTRVMVEAYDDVAAARGRVAAVAPRVDRMRHVPANGLAARGRRTSRDLAAYAESVVPLYRAASRVAGTRTVLDSSKDPSYLFALGATRRIDLRVVHLVRDSRAVAFSWTRHRQRPEVHWEERLMRQVAPRRSAAVWTEYNTAVDLFGLVQRDVHRVRYEDFASDPGAVAGALATATGTPRRRTASGARHSFSGNPVRFRSGPLEVTVDDAWRRQLGRRDRRTVTALTAPLLVRYGYPLWT